MKPAAVIEGIEIYRDAPAALRPLLYEGHRWWKRTFGSISPATLEEGLRLWKRPSEAQFFIDRPAGDRHRRALELARRHVKGRVLDLACGVGFLLRELGSEAIGLDSSFANLILARRFVAPSARLLCADASAGLPLDDGAVDGVTCMESFTFIPNRDALAREIRRVWNGRSSIVLSHLHTTPVPHARPVAKEELETLFPGGRLEPEGEGLLTLVVEPA